MLNATFDTNDHLARTAVDEHHGQRAEVRTLALQARYLSMKAIEERGWTATMISDLLGEPDHYVENPYYRSAAPCKMYELDQVKAEEAKAEYAARIAKLAARRRGKDYTPAFVRKYGVASAAIVDAAESLFSLNRYAKHDTCTAKHRDEIYSLKSGFVRWLVEGGHLAGWGVHEVVKPEKILSCYCVGYGGSGCHRCGYTGIHKTLPELVLRFVVLRFVVEERSYTWHQPAESVAYEYVSKAPQLLDVADWAPEREKPIEMPRSRFARAKALIRWVMDPEPESTPTAAGTGLAIETSGRATP